MNILLIEDEPRAARRLDKLVRQILPNASIVGPVDSVSGALKAVAASSPLDLIVSDIQLSDGLSFAFFEAADIQCPIIFTTAFDQYAIKAFKVNGIDYLLKPIDEEELRKALDKFESQHISHTNQSMPDLQTVAAQLAQLTAVATYKDRFMVRVGEKIKSFSVDEIYAVYSKDKATHLLVDSGRSYIIDQTVEEVTSLIDPKLFFRVNRAFLVHLNAVSEVSAHSNSRLRLVLKTIEQEAIIVARERTADFKRWLGA